MTESKTRFFTRGKAAALALVATLGTGVWWWTAAKTDAKPELKTEGKSALQGETKSGEAKTGEVRGGEAKSGEAKGGEAKGGEAKGAGKGGRGGAGGGPVAVTTAVVKQQNLPVTITANGSVTALQAVDVRAQVASTVKSIHVAEGHTVGKGALLFTLDARGEEANIKRAEAQASKTRSDLANAERTLKRQRELFEQKFISQSALDSTINAADLLRGQLQVDEAAVESSRVAKSFTEIRAPLSGRTGAINVRVGSLVQPNTAALVTISQLDPIGVAFSLPERELPHVQRALAKGALPVTVELAGAPKQTLTGKLTFIESTIDVATGTIAMKAAFNNTGNLLWPGMFVSASLSPRVIADALVVPVEAVQSGPESKFVYVVIEEGKVKRVPVQIELIESGLAVIKGVSVGDRVVVEGAQNVRPNSTVIDSNTDAKKIGGPRGERGERGEKAGKGKRSAAEGEKPKADGTKPHAEKP